MGGDAQALCADRNTAEPEGTKKVAMAEATQFTIGVDASCTDGVCGEVSRVVIDPVAQAVTHLVVEPKHRQGLGRLVPLDLIDATPEEVKLRCTTAEFGQLDAAEETQFLPGSSGYAGYRPGQTFSWPFYGLGWGMPGAMGMGSLPQTVIYDTVPLGEVTVRRGEQVHATDGDIGRVQGLVINPRDHHVTHVLLQEGHLWGRKEVAIPIGAVTRVDDGIQLTMSKQDVQELPPVDINHPNG
jgi:sporulation protein YlmC with PRC-barrel domain